MGALKKKRPVCAHLAGLLACAPAWGCRHLPSEGGLPSVPCFVLFCGLLSHGLRFNEPL